MSATDPRTDAGAAELQHQMMLFRSPNIPGGGTELLPSEYVKIAQVVLAAADAVDTRVQQLTEELQIANERGDEWRRLFHADTLELEKLRAALRPFAEAANIFDHCADETLHIHPHVPLGDFRRARAVLAEVDASQEPAAVSGEPGDAT